MSTRARAFFPVFVLAACLIPTAASAQSYIGVGGGLFSDDGELQGEETRDVARSDDESFQYESDNLLMGSIWYLRHATDSVRWGGGLRYYGSYEILEIPEDPDNDDEIQPFELGQLTDFYVQGEFLLPFGGNKALLLGAQAGPSLLVPDGEFQRTIDDLDEQGVDVWNTPRLGFNLAPFVGGTWEIDDRLTARADLGVRYEQLFLLAIDDNVDGVAFEKSWSTSALRYELGLSFEVEL